MQGIFFPPNDIQKRDQWREKLHQWRDASRYLMNYDDSLYSKPEFEWVSRTFSLGLVMMADLQFYNPKSGQYTIDKLLDNAIERFGGYDAIMLWHAYPNIGFDDRNQFDFYRDALDGLDGLRALVRRCHERGVKVYIDYNPWDTGTRRESVSDTEALAELVAAIDADAIFLDTMAFGVAGLREKLDEIRPGVALESEVLLPLDHLHTHPASWAQSLPASDIPGVLRNKWFERRHMQHRIKRWQCDHTEELHLAWMNGTGVVIWENVFGTDQRWSQRDCSILRAMLPIQRRYVSIFSGEGWKPLISTENDAICASQWEGESLTLWTLCNREEYDVSGKLLTVPYSAHLQFFDLIRGVPLTPHIVDNNRVELHGTVRPSGVSAIICGDETSFDADFYKFLVGQHQLDTRADFDPTPPPHIEWFTRTTRTHLHPPDAIPEGMVFIPARRFTLNVQFRVRECGFYHVEGMPELDLRFQHLHKIHTLTRPIDVAAFALDKTPVTNAEFAKFLQQSGYVPTHSQNFLKHWSDGQLPSALEDHPVVYVDLEDMRAYAKWAGKRLPTEEEWQHAAQGFDELKYPWGSTFRAHLCNAAGETAPVTAYPDGRSPFGCFDMCGNVWEMTESERSDGQTRFCILKGGSHYRAYGSDWYADGNPQPNAFAAKMLLSWPALNRCATIGFRCAVDLIEATGQEGVAPLVTDS